MAIGYACLTKHVPGTDLKHCLLRSATEDLLSRTTSHNLASLGRAVSYASDAGIGMLRISSDLIPFGSMPEVNGRWAVTFSDDLAAIGKQIRKTGLRVSMHPGQYTVLNSPRPEVVRRSREDLAYHAALLDSLGVDRSHKIIVHIGGVYGERKEAVRRFCTQYRLLDEGIRSRLVIENDDRCFAIGDLLEISAETGAPVVFDNLHHALNCRPGDEANDIRWVGLCAKTWKPEDGRQKIHYSQQDPGKRPGSHSATIAATPFLAFFSEVREFGPDIMLEVKDKNISAVKCVNCTTWPLPEPVLWEEWGRYRLALSERSLEAAFEIPTMLERQGPDTPLAFYRKIERIMALETIRSQVAATARQSFDLFRELASEQERRRFERTLELYENAKIPEQTLKRRLKTLCERYRVEHILTSYYYL